MLKKIERKMTDVVEFILAKPAENFTKSDFDILSAEWWRLKMEIDNKEHGKRMEEMISNICDK